MHDTLKGVFAYDGGQILYVFIVEKKLFTCEQMNQRMKSSSYGPDEIRNKPREIPIQQVKNRFLKMSASKSLCFFRNIGLILGDLIEPEDPHWQLIIFSKEILDIITFPVVNENVAASMETLVSGYLTLLRQLIDSDLKFKHHIS